MATAVLSGKRAPFGPLFLHGPPGSGKTKLLTAALGALITEADGTSARLVPAGELARPDDEGFADRGLQTCDLLVIEDIQHLPGRAADAACDLIDRRTSRGRALAISAGSGPADLEHLPRRLTSRLAAGLVVQLEPLGFSSQREVLAATARAGRVSLTPDALDWLARQGEGIRAALGLLQKLGQLAPRFPGPLDRDAAERILGENEQLTSPNDRGWQIVKRVGAEYGVAVDELMGVSRLRGVLVPRQVAMYLMRELTLLSLPQIGAAFGGRDHTTVLHACRKVAAELSDNEALAAVVRRIKGELG